MFFSSNQYPSLAHLPVAERKRVVALATKTQNPWIGRRFGIVLALIGVGTVILGLVVPPLTDQELLAYATGAGVLFYLYLLAEINGPIRKAVETHALQMSQGQNKQKN